MVGSFAVLVVLVLVVAVLVLPAAHFQAQASEAVNGAPCEVPENAAEIEETYRTKSDAVLTNWELESVDVGCGGDISASYVLPEFSDDNTTFRVYQQQDQPLQDEEDLFPKNFIEQRDTSVAQSISSMMSNYIFKAADEEFTNKTVSFSYGTDSYFYISAYKGFENCRSDFEVDMLHPELLDLTISNDASIDTIPLIKIAREHASGQLQNASNGDAIRIRNVSDASCGQTHVGTSYSIDNRAIAPYSYSALIDLECDATVPDDECPEQIQLVYGTTFQSPVVSNMLNGTKGGDDDSKQLPQLSGQEKEVGESDAWFYNTIVPIGIGSVIAGVAAFVMFRRL